MENKPIKSLYIHFPYCRHLCNYCDFYKVRSQQVMTDNTDFFSYLKKSWDLVAEQSFKFDALETIYLGGGTPSLLGKKGLTELFQLLKSFGLVVADKCEITLEVDPGAWSPGDEQTWRHLGINRLSFGLQSLDENIYTKLDRPGSFRENLRCLEYFIDKSFLKSYDFLLGAPDSTQRSIEEELLRVLQYQPSHLSLYILTVQKNYPLYLQLPGDERISTEYLQVSDILKNHQFHHYEVSNFARNGHYSRHNLTYWSEKSWMALGPSASATIYMQDNSAIRWNWKANIPEYRLEQLTSDNLRTERLYLGLRTYQGLDYSFMENSERIAFERCISIWMNQGLVGQHRDSYICLNSRGWLILDSLIDQFYAVHVSL